MMVVAVPFPVPLPRNIVQPVAPKEVLELLTVILRILRFARVENVDIGMVLTIVILH